MKVKDLFKYSDVEYVPAEEDLQQQENRITTYAHYHNIKIKIELGLYLNPSTTECERVLKLTCVGENPVRNKIKREKDCEKIERIISYLKKGYTLKRMAEIEGCTKQAISAFIKYNNIKNQMK